MRQLKDLLNDKRLMDKVDFIRISYLFGKFENPALAGPAKYLDVIEKIFGERYVDCFDIYGQNEITLSIIII